MVLAPSEGLSRVVLVGLGKDADHTPRGMEEAAGHACAALARDAAAAIAADGMPASHAAHAALGAGLRAYRFDRYRTKEGADDKPKLRTLAVLADDPAAAAAAWAPLSATLHGVMLSRDLVSEPPNVLTPTVMAERCRALTELGVEVEVLGPQELERIGMRALLAVAMGSAQEARVVTMRWMGGREAGIKPVCLVGKGVTFDTGGISIKPAPGMEDMKWDMAGAGAVVGAMAVLAGRKAKCNVVGVVGLVENMPSGTAQRPGDVVRSCRDRPSRCRTPTPRAGWCWPTWSGTRRTPSTPPHGGPGDADRAPSSWRWGMSTPGCSATTTPWPTGCWRRARRRGRRCGGCPLGTPMTSSSAPTSPT